MPFAKQSAFLVDYSKKSQEGQAMRSNIFWVLSDVVDWDDQAQWLGQHQQISDARFLSLTICINLLQLHDMIHFTLAEV